MSMMSPESVGFDVNVGGNFSASLSQMIAQSDAYARSADTMLGKVALLNVGVTSLISRTAALTGVSKIATAEAAAYQDRLASVAGTAKVTGQSFAALEKTTLSLARTTGNIGQAVATVEALGVSGLTTTRSIDAMAKAWTNLGVANNTSGIALGQTMLQLGRSFGTSERALVGFGDALTYTSKKYGASAMDAAQFAKSLAPVAATVGITQGAVQGLGVAAARLGEDGFASATAFNKVMLQMNSSMRNGSPEIKEYAGLLGLTQDNLAKMFKQDPTEVILRFTEAIGKGGPQAMRTLEALGLDATRTVKALTAMSSQGNLRAIVQTSMESYGSGDTAKAAATSLSTVNAEARKLGETMSQTVAAAGRPFLGFMDAVLKVSNSLASSINTVVSSPLPQWLQKVAAVGGFGLSAASGLIGTMSLLGVGAVGLRAAGGARSRFMTAAEISRGNLEGPQAAGLMSRMGAGYGGFVPEALFGAGLMPGMGWGARAAAVGRGAINLTALGMTSQARMIEGIRGGTIPYTAAGEEMRAGLGQVWRGGPNAAAGLGGGNWMQNFGRQVEASGKITATWAKEVTTATGATRTLGRSLLQTAASVGGGLGAIGGRGIAGVGGMLGGLVNPYVLGGAAAVGGTVWLMQHQKEQAAIDAGIKAGATDPYAHFNEFANAAGLANKALQGFGEQVKATTEKIASDTQVDASTGAVTLSGAQRTQARTPGYVSAFTMDKKGRPASFEAAQLRLMLGPNADPQAVTRALMDLTAQKGVAYGNEVAQHYNALAGGPQENVYSAGFAAAGRSYNWRGKTGETRQIGADITGEAMRNIAGAQAQYGDQAVPAARTREVQRIFAAMKGVTDPHQQEIAADVLAQLTGGKKSQFQTLLGRNDVMLGQTTAFDAYLAQQKLYKGDKVKGDYSFYDAATKEGATGTGLVSVSGAGIAETPLEKSAKKLDLSFTLLTNRSNSVGAALYEATDLTRKLGKEFGDLKGDDTKGMTALGRTILAYTQGPNDITRSAAAGGVAGAALRGSGGSRALAGAQLMAQMAGMTDADLMQPMLALARQQLAAGSVVGDRTLSMMSRTGGALQAGGVARSMGVQTGAAETDRQAVLSAEQQAYAERLDFQKQFVMASKQLDIQLARQSEDTAIARARAEHDYQVQVTYSTQDFHRQRYIAERDFGIQMKRAAEDSAKAIYDPYQRIQAQMVTDTTSLLVNLSEQNAAIDKQTSQVAQLRKMGLSRQAIDTLSLADPKNAQQVSRLLEEAVADPALLRQMNAVINQRLKSTKAATQSDNNVDFRRATEDFDKSMRDSTKSFNIQLSRMADSHALQLDRMAEDTHRSRLRAQQDLARMGTEVTGDVESIARQFVGRVAKLPASVGPAMSANLTDMMGTAVADAQTEMAKLTDPMGLQQTMETLFKKLYDKWAAMGGALVSPITTQTGAGSGPSVGTVGQSLPNTAGQAMAFGAGESEHASQDWTRWCDRFVARAYGLARSGYLSAKDHWDHIPARFKTSGKNAPPGALYFWGNGAEGHTALSVGGGNVYSTDFVRRGKVDLTSEAAISKSWGSYRGWSYPYFAGKTAPVGMYAGGIATRPLNVDIAERGGSEAVIPLDHRGANVLAQAMVRYVDGSSVQGARMSAFGTTVNSYHYDHSVRVTGPVSVVAQDVNEMGRRLDEKARQDRLAQPVGR